MLIYNAFGWTTPTFAHVSLILAPDKSKLSKRHGATSVGDFRGQGFLPDAMVNYLSLLGWNDGTEQVHSTSHTSILFDVLLPCRMRWPTNDTTGVARRHQAGAHNCSRNRHSP